LGVNGCVIGSDLPAFQQKATYDKIQQAVISVLNKERSLVFSCTIIGMHEQAQEEFHVFHLNTKHQVTGMQLISRGTLNASLVHPREVFKGALLANAYALILAHNHPSGNTEPSNADKQVTTTLINASKLLDIHILDHLIIGSTGTYFSFRESGLIPS